MIYKHFSITTIKPVEKLTILSFFWVKLRRYEFGDNLEHNIGFVICNICFGIIWKCKYDPWDEDMDFV